MGKATIISGGEEGLYKIRVNLHRDNIDATIAKMQAEIAALDDQLTEVDKQITLMDAEIAALASNPTAQTLKIQERLAVYIRKNTLTIKIKALQRRIAYLEESMPEDPEIDAWCADFSEDLTGAVGTVEVPGERGTVLIRPGFETAAHDPARDGVLEPAIAADPAGACYNWAMLPGWQKWKPTHRFAVITSLSELDDRCDVALEETTSSAQALDINQTETLSNVPIVYMDGNAEAFEEGDDVLVEFTGRDWTAPRVIGFKDHPRACDFNERFGDYKVPTDYDWVYWTETDKGLIRQSSYLDGSNFVITINGSVLYANSEETPYQLERHEWATTFKRQRKLKQYLVIKTKYRTVPGHKDVLQIVVRAQGPGIIWGGDLYNGPYNLLYDTSSVAQTYVYDLYAVVPELGVQTFYEHPDNRMIEVGIWAIPLEGAIPRVYSWTVAIDSIRVTDNPPPPTESIWI